MPTGAEPSAGPSGDSHDRKATPSSRTVPSRSPAPSRLSGILTDDDDLSSARGYRPDGSPLRTGLIEYSMTSGHSSPWSASRSLALTQWVQPTLRSRSADGEGGRRRPMTADERLDYHVSCRSVRRRATLCRRAPSSLQRKRGLEEGSPSAQESTAKKSHQAEIMDHITSNQEAMNVIVQRLQAAQQQLAITQVTMGGEFGRQYDEHARYVREASESSSKMVEEILRLNGHIEKERRAREEECASFHQLTGLYRQQATHINEMNNAAERRIDELEDRIDHANVEYDRVVKHSANLEKELAEFRRMTVDRERMFLEVEGKYEDERQAHADDIREFSELRAEGQDLHTAIANVEDSPHSLCGELAGSKLRVADAQRKLADAEVRERRCQARAEEAEKMLQKSVDEVTALSSQLQRAASRSEPNVECQRKCEELEAKLAKESVAGQDACGWFAVPVPARRQSRVPAPLSRTPGAT